VDNAPTIKESRTIKRKPGANPAPCLMNSGFDVGLDLQAASHRLIVIASKSASLHVRSDFHTYPYSIRILTLNLARRRHTLGFEAEDCRSPIHARTGRRINHGAEIFLYASCIGMLASGGRLARRCAQLAVGRQPAADGLRKRSPIGTRRKSRVRKPGFCVCGVGMAIGKPCAYGRRSLTATGIAIEVKGRGSPHGQE